MQELFTTRHWKHGLVSYPAAEDLAEGAGTVFKNCTGEQEGKLVGITDKVLYASGPGTAGYTMQWFAECRINDTDVLIAYLNDSDAASALDKDRFFYSTDTGTTWIEITEYLATSITGGNTTDFTINDAPTTNSADYLKHWICIRQGDTKFDYVTAYDESTKTVTVKYGVGAASGNITFIRFPLWTNNAFYAISPADYQNFLESGITKPMILKRNNAVAILTARQRVQTGSNSDGFQDFPSIWFSYLDKEFLNDSDFDFTGYHAESKYLDSFLDNVLVTSLAAAASTNNALPDADDYGILLSYVTDDGQESKIYWDNDNLLPSSRVVTVASGESLSFTLRWTRFTSTPWQYHIFSRRITAIRIYVAKVSQVNATPEYHAKSGFYFCKEIDVNDDSWSGATHDYASIEIGKKEWLAGLAEGDAQYSLGFFSQYRVGSDFADAIDGREVAASLAVETQTWAGSGVQTNKRDRTSYAAVTPINAAGINQADTIPETKLQDVARDGINEIYAIKRLGIYCVIFGRSMSVVYRIDEQNFLASVRNKKGKGTTGYFAVYGNGQEIWWLSDDGVYYINESTATTILSEPIRDKIQNISDKAGAIIGFDNDDKVLYLYADTTMYIYDYKAQQWRTYEQSSDWKWLTPNLSNKMLATDGTDIYELQPKSGSTGTLTARFRSPVFNVATHLRKLEIDYSTNVAITITAYDERNSSVPLVKPLKLLPNRDARAQRKQLFDFNIKSKRLYFDIDATWNTATQDWEIGQIRGLGDPKPILKQE